MSIDKDDLAGSRLNKASGKKEGLSRSCNFSGSYGFGNFLKNVLLFFATWFLITDTDEKIIPWLYIETCEL